jgi:hypothetical protein
MMEHRRRRITSSNAVSLFENFVDIAPNQAIFSQQIAAALFVRYRRSVANASMASNTGGSGS